MDEYAEIQNPSETIDAKKKWFDTSKEIVFGIRVGDPDEYGDALYTGFVDFSSTDPRIQKNAELAVEEMFKAGADLEKVQLEEERKGLKPFSDQAIALEKPGKCEIAYDYVMGRRDRPESAAIASEVFKDYLDQATKTRDIYYDRKLKQVNLKTQRETPEQIDMKYFQWGTNKQFRKRKVLYQKDII